MTDTRRGRPNNQVEGQAELLDLTDDLRGSAGPVELAARVTIEAAALDRVDTAAAVLAIELGRAVDIGNRRRDPYAVAAAARELREQLIRLRLDPVSRGEGADDDNAFDRWAASLGAS